MSTESTPIERTMLQRLKAGPNAAVKRAPGWQWTEVVWCLGVLGWFGTTGRASELAVATGLIVYWVFGPAIGIFIGGNLLVLALEILPTAVLPLVVTELLLFTPVLLEAATATANRTAVGVNGVAALLIVITAVGGGWLGWSVPTLIAAVTGGYVLCVVGMQVTPGLYAPRTSDHADRLSEDRSE